ncbi:MAG: hypothetical protein RBR54_11000 [Sulfurimonas sp.]|jgi:DNA-binding NarL/FixJ family response regulator|nr:hypothetical protein [Sulfurimonas sp.]
MRLTLNKKEVEYILKKIENRELETKIKKQLEIEEQRDVSKKSKSALKATKIRSDRAKAKIQNAINILRMENRKISYYSIAQSSGVSYSTVKKYVTL